MKEQLIHVHTAFQWELQLAIVTEDDKTKAVFIQCTKYVHIWPDIMEVLSILSDLMNILLPSVFRFFFFSLRCGSFFLYKFRINLHVFSMIYSHCLNELESKRTNDRNENV